MALNLKTEKGKDIMQEFIKGADSFMGNFAPGTIDRIGWGYDVVRESNPAILYTPKELQRPLPTNCGRQTPTVQPGRFPIPGVETNAVRRQLTQTSSTTRDHPMAPNDAHDLQQLLAKIYGDRGVDFRQYKANPLQRRIDRRLRATQAASYADYCRVLECDPGEYDKLLDGLTINISEFFRDPPAFQALAAQVVPELIRAKERTQPGIIRAWSAGCAGGEEPYSLAILLRECLGDRLSDYHISIDGTDIDEKSLNHARGGEYPAAALAGVPNALVQKYFSYNGAYRIAHESRGLVRFRRHNLVSDGPLIHIDLIACRNVLIYFTRELQVRLLMDFYRGLNPGGWLFLGQAETLIGEAASLFQPLDKRWRLYRKPCM